MDITATATAAATVIAAIGGAISFYYNGRQKTIEETNNKKIEDLVESNKFLNGRLEAQRNEVLRMEEEFRLLKEEVLALRVENKDLREDCSAKVRELEEENEKHLNRIRELEATLK